MLYLYAQMRVSHREAFLNYVVAGDSGVKCDLELSEE